MSRRSILFVLLSLPVSCSCLPAGDRADALLATGDRGMVAVGNGQDVAASRSFDVHDYGARGDGVTGDTAAVQAAVDAAGEAGGGTVHFSAGTYVVEGIMMKSRTILEGSDGATLRLKDHAGGGIIDAKKQSNIRIKNLNFDPNAAGQGESRVPQSRWTVRLRECDHCWIENCRFTTSLENSVDLYLSSYCWVTNCHFSDKVHGSPSETAVTDVHATSCTAVTVRDCRMIHTAPSAEALGIVGVFFSGVSNGLIADCTMNNCGRGGAQSHQGAAIDLYSIANRGIHVEDNTIEHYVYMGIRLRGTDLHVARNRVSANRSFASNANGIEASHASREIARVWIMDNDVNCIGGGTSGYGIYTTSGDDPGDANFVDFHIVGNTVRNASTGILVAKSCIGLDVSRNRISGTSSQAISVNADPNMVISDVTISHNRIDMTGNTTTLALFVDARNVSIANNVILNAKYGIGLEIPLGGLMQGNIVEASSYEFYYYDETQNLLSVDNLNIGTGDTDYHEGSDVVWKRSTGGTYGITNFYQPVSVRDGSNGPGYLNLYEDSDYGTNYIRLQGATIGANRTVDLSQTGFLKTVIKTIDVDDDASTDDYRFDDDAANATKQVITLTSILPAYAELAGCQVRCFETVTGSASMLIELGTTSGGAELLTGSPDTANDIITTAAGSAPALIATDAARSLYLSGTPGANWSTLDAGRWSVMLTYMDYAAVHSQKNP